MIILLKKTQHRNRSTVSEWITSVGYKPHISPGRRTDAHRRHRRRPRKGPVEGGGLPPRRGKGRPILQTLQARREGSSTKPRPSSRSATSGSAAVSSPSWPVPCSVESGRAADGVRLCRQKGGGEDPPGRRLQAADVALQLPRSGGGGAQTPEEGRRKGGDAGS